MSLCGMDGVGTAYSGKAFIRRFVLGTSESRKFKIVVKFEATVDALWVCFISALGVSVRSMYGRKGKYIYISAWASALLVQLRWAMREP